MVIKLANYRRQSKSVEKFLDHIATIPPDMARLPNQRFWAEFLPDDLPEHASIVHDFKITVQSVVGKAESKNSQSIARHHANWQHTLFDSSSFKGLQQVQYWLLSEKPQYVLRTRRRVRRFRRSRDDLCRHDCKMILDAADTVAPGFENPYCSTGMSGGSSYVKCSDIASYLMTRQL